MEIINRRQRIFSIARKLRRENRTIAFVPTMGSLHGGHLELIKQARQMSDAVIVSIFVNPTQFNDRADLERYPRDLAGDAALLADYDVDYIFAPELHEIYPDGFATYIYVEGLTDSLEGASRPGHFRGVATVVTILLNTIRPDFAVFGQKDAQQIAVVKRLTRDLGFETEIISVPTVREPSGLALSSRNSLLTENERDGASVIYRALSEAKEAASAGQRNASKLAEMVRTVIETEPLANIDYIAVVDADTLEPIEKIGDREAMIAIAVRFGEIRLIDNVKIGKRQ